MGTRARKYCACCLLRQVRPNSRHGITSLGHERQAEASPYDLVWGIGYRADQGSANRATSLPPPTHHQPLSPQGDSPSSRDQIFEVYPSTRQRLCPGDTSAAASPSGYPDSVPNVRSDHGGDVSAVMAVAHSSHYPPLLVEQGPCLVAGVVTMDDSSFTTNQDPQRPRCRATRRCRPLGYGLATDLNQHPRRWRA